MLSLRIITVIVGIPLIIGLLWLGGWFWQAMFLLVAVVGLYEYLAMLRHRDIQAMTIPSYLLLSSIIAGVWLKDEALLMIFLAILIMISIMVVRYPRYHFSDLVHNFFGAFYIAFSLALAMLLEGHQQAFALMLLVFILTWGSDIGGFLFGRAWGKRKLAPELSPKKTWAGALGGLILTIILAMVYCSWLPSLGISLAGAALLGLMGSVTAQLGDLFMSGVKRYCGVKDSGKIIPGHGGVLDRFDSFLLVLPTMYLLLRWQGIIIL